MTQDEGLPQIMGSRMLREEGSERLGRPSDSKITV